MRDIIKSGFILFIISVIVALALATTYSVTKNIIGERKLERAREARVQAMPNAENFEEIENIDFSVGVVKAVYSGVVGDNIVGRVFEVEGNGYGGLVQVTVGIDDEGRITGVIIGENNETPGLGDKVTKEEFLNQFKDISSKQPLKAVKNPSAKEEEIHIATGATVSTEAIVDAVQTAVDVNNEIINSRGDL